jgi:hypothetical protein
METNHVLKITCAMVDMTSFWELQTPIFKSGNLDCVYFLVVIRYNQTIFISHLLNLYVFFF